MKIIKSDFECTVGYCHNELSTPEQLDMGLCSRHYKELISKNHLSVICWNCGQVLETYHRREIIRGVQIPDRYLFVETCPLCDNVDKRSLKLMTINGSPAKRPLRVNKSGQMKKEGLLSSES